MSKLNKTQTAGVVIAIVALVLLVGGVVLFFLTDPFGKEAPPKPTVPAATVSPPVSSPDEATRDTAAPTGTAASAAASESTAPSESSETTAPVEEATAPSAMQALLSEGGCSVEELESIAANQLIIVHSSGTSAEITFYEHTPAGWQQDEGLTCPGFVGMNGTTPEMSESIAATPQGLYSIGSAFYQNSPPATGLNTFAITSDTYWVDDPDSSHYNQKVIGSDNRDWNSAEHMSNISGYRYGFVINYNIPPTGYARGSAIFFHIGNGGPTHGCVSATEDMVLAYLAKLDANKNPHILII